MNPVEQTTIVSVEMSEGDPGYFCLGHVDRELFLERVNFEYGEEFELADVRHIYHTMQAPDAETKPDRYGEGDNYWWACERGDAGAFPVTFVRYRY